MHNDDDDINPLISLFCKKSLILLNGASTFSCFGQESSTPQSRSVLPKPLPLK